MHPNSSYSTTPKSFTQSPCVINHLNLKVSSDFEKQSVYKTGHAVAFDALPVCLQYVSWYEEDSVGGMEKCVADMLQADPDFGTSRVRPHQLVW